MFAKSQYKKAALVGMLVLVLVAVFLVNATSASEPAGDDLKAAAKYAGSDYIERHPSNYYIGNDYHQRHPFDPYAGSDYFEQHRDELVP